LLNNEILVQIELTEDRELIAIYYDKSKGRTVETSIKDLLKFMRN